jgi:hypothetical protein
VSPSKETALALVSMPEAGFLGIKMGVEVWKLHVIDGFHRQSSVVREQEGQHFHRSSRTFSYEWTANNINASQLLKSRDKPAADLHVFATCHFNSLKNMRPLVKHETSTSTPA